MFWVYRNVPNDRVIIHRASCGFCNDGEGLHRQMAYGNGLDWVGPFATLEGAWREAQKPLHRFHRGRVLFGPPQECSRCLT